MTPFKQRLRRLSALFLLAALAVATRAFWIQVVGDSRIERLSERQFRANVLIRPTRGLILDRNQQPLVVNSEFESLAADPGKVKLNSKLLQQLAQATGVKASILKEKLKSDRGFVWIKRRLSEGAADQLKHFGVGQAKVPGLWLVREAQRSYPNGKLADEILGTVNIDQEGIEGVELWLNSTLRGMNTNVEAVRDALGRPAFLDTKASFNRQDGSPVALTLDAPLQFAVERRLADAVHRTQSRSGNVIVMDAVSGEILAMATASAYENGRRARAITDAFEPGSVIKPFLVLGALQNGVKSNFEIWGGKGSFQIRGHTITEAETHEKFEWLSLAEMLKFSSNVGAAKLAIKIGAEKSLKVLRDFGFGEKTGVGFPGEISAWLPSSPKKITELSLATLGFGQGITSTSLQVARAYAAILNGGWLVKPTLLKEGGSNPASNPPRRVASSEHTDFVLKALKAVTETGGTGEAARLDGFEIAGKTGTAQVVLPGTKKYSSTHYLASFAGFILGVEPKLVVLTQLDGPQGVYYSSQTAAPLFREVAQEIVMRFNIPSTVAPTVAQKPASTDEVLVGAAVPQRAAVPLVAEEDMVYRMPDLTGLSARAALRLFEGRSFEVRLDGFGWVKNQKPEAGARIVEGDVIKLVLTDLAEPKRADSKRTESRKSF